MGPKAAKSSLFIDTEDHPNAGPKTVSLSSPGHAVSLLRRGRFWEALSVSSRSASQSHFEVRNGPQSCKIMSFYRF